MCDVDLPTGRLQESELDFRLPGPMELVLQRQYRSTNEHGSDLGPGWGHTWGLRLQVESSERCWFHAHDGRRIPLGIPDVRQMLVSNSVEKTGIAFVPVEKLPTPGLRQELVAGGFAVVAPGTHAAIFDARVNSDGCHAWRAIADAVGNCVVITADERGRPLIAETPWLRRLRFQRSSTGRLEAVTVEYSDRPESRIELIRYDYDGHGRLISAADVAGVRRYEYAGTRMTRHRNRLGASCETTYDREGRVRTSKLFGGAKGRTFSYEEGCTAVVNSLGAATQTKFNASKQVEETVDEIGGCSRFVYDSSARLCQALDQNGGVTTFVYRPDGKPVGKIDPAGHTAIVEFNDRGDLARQMSPNGVVVQQITRDSFGQVTSLARAGRGCLELKHAANGDVSEVTTPYGRTAQLAWSKDRTVLTESDDEGARSQQRFNLRGDLVEAVDAAGARTQYEYDAAGQLCAVVHADGTRELLRSDVEGHLLEYRNSAGDRFGFEYDDAGRRIVTRLPNGEVVRSQYDTESKLTEVRAPGGGTFRFKYDARGLLAAQAFPDGRQEEYERDARGQLIAMGDGDQYNCRIVRDPVGAVTEIQYPDGSTKSTERNADGQWLSIQWHGHTLSRRLDGQGRTEFEQQGELQLYREYNDAGVVCDITDGGGRRVHYDYNSDGQVAGVTVTDGQWQDDRWQATSVPRQYAFEYDRCGRLSKWVLPNGKSETRHVDDLGRVLRQSICRGDQTIVQREYRYDAVGRVTRIEDSVRGVSHYRYDAVGRLVGVTTDRATFAYAYDEAGNRYDERRQQFAPGNRLIAMGDMRLEYNAQGQLARRRTSTDAVRYAYTGLGYLASVDNGNSAVRYAYDGLYRLIRRSTAGRQEQYHWQDLALWAIHDAESIIHFVWTPQGDVPLEQAQDGRSFSIHTDHLGRVMELIDDDGAIVWQNWDDAWGNRSKSPTLERSQVACRLGLPGQIWDDEVELYSNRHRFYDPSLQRYITPDPVGIWGGVDAYTYVLDPMNLMDPLGLKCRGKTDDPTLYRGDSRSPDVICKEGFKPRNPSANLSLFTHVEGVPDTGSNWISTTHDSSVATNFGDSGGYVYEIANPGCGQEVDCDPDVMAKYGDPADSEHEIAFNKSIPPQNIKGFWSKVGGQATFQACP